MALFVPVPIHEGIGSASTTWTVSPLTQGLKQNSMLQRIYGRRGSRIVKVVSLSLTLLLWVTPACARRNAQALVQSGQGATTVIRVSSELVVLDVLAENKKTGTPIGNLDAKDFVVTEDGEPQRINYFSRDQLPLSVVFLFDLTETVQPILKPLAEGAFEILGHLKPQDQVAIMVFSSHTELLQDFTTDRRLAAVAVSKASKMSSGDGTFIHEDMYEAVEQALKSTPPEFGFRDCRTRG